MQTYCARVIRVMMVFLLSVVVAVGFILVSCARSTQVPVASESEESAQTSVAATSQGGAGAQALAELSGRIEVDGSSTVYLITEAIAEEFAKVSPKVQVTVGISGTGGGMKRFKAGEIDICDASRAIESEEARAAAQNNVEFIELPVAYDGISIVVNPSNSWCDSITIGELKKMWEPAAEGAVTRWNQVRSSWPDQELHLFGPGTDSGTFEYFTEKVVGRAKASRGDYTPSEDDNVLVQGVAGDELALGYFGYAYYVENADRLKLVAVDAGNGPVSPSVETINNGTYFLARPLFIYVKKASVSRPEVDAFVKFYIQNAASAASEVGYVPLPQRVYQLVLKRYEQRRTGTIYEGGAMGTLEELLSR